MVGVAVVAGRVMFTAVLGTVGAMVDLRTNVADHMGVWENNKGCYGSLMTS